MEINTMYRCILAVLTLVFSIFTPACGGSGSPESTSNQTTSVITEYDITWTFNKPVRYGQFANGHYWVLGPVNVIGISPEYDGYHHGWEVNPDNPVAQGFDGRIADFSPARVPSLPYSAKPGESLVKAVSIIPYDSDCLPCLKSASVVTVLSEVPPDEGRTIFRPPYFGTEKPLYSTADIQAHLLPSLPPTKSAPSLVDVTRQYQMVQLDHKSGWTGRHMHPKEAMPDYGSNISNRNATAVLTLMLNRTVDEKWDALIRYVNNGIDIYHMSINGVHWSGNGGHSEGRKLPAVFAAVLLNNQTMKDYLASSNSTMFGENSAVIFSETANQILYAQLHQTEDKYWTNIVFDKGSRTIADPYLYIDGGHRPGGSYQFCCLSQPWRATVTALKIMPELRSVFNKDELITYVDRWVEIGTWTQPDPCAPPTGVCSSGNNPGLSCTSANETEVCTGENAFCDQAVNWATDYGIKYGPDGNGHCIQDTNHSDGIGRFPQLHKTATDGGHYRNSFAEEMWDTYLK